MRETHGKSLFDLVTRFPQGHSETLTRVLFYGGGWGVFGLHSNGETTGVADDDVRLQAGRFAKNFCLFDSDSARPSWMFPA